MRSIHLGLPRRLRQATVRPAPEQTLGPRPGQDIRMLSTDVCVPLSHFCLLIEARDRPWDGRREDGRDDGAGGLK